MRAVFWPTGAGAREKRSGVSLQVDVDGGLINTLTIEFLKINDELWIIIAIRIQPRGQETVFYSIAFIHL